jgi:hypothetical protein
MKGALLVLAVGGIVLVGCGDGELRTLSPSDVVGIPPGNATGSLFAGHYMLTRVWKGPCRCRVGTCGTITIDAGPGTVTVMQTDGTMQYRNDAANAAPCDGGIDSDGSFVCGQSQIAAAGSSYSLTTGQFALANGQPASFSGLSESTLVLPGLDCDLQIGAEAAYLGP